MTDTAPFGWAYALTAVAAGVALIGLPVLVLLAWQAARRFAGFLAEMESGRMRPTDLDAYRARRAVDQAARRGSA